MTPMPASTTNCPESSQSWDSQADRVKEQRHVLRLVGPTPNDVNGTVSGRSSPPPRINNSDRRSREHLSQDEVKLLVKAARSGRYGDRDAAAIWIAYNHGLRVSELCDLRWQDVRWGERKLTVRRLKGSRSGEHDLTETDLRMLGPVRKARSTPKPADHVFINERGAPMTAAGFRKMLARLTLPDDLTALAIHPHMLRHAAGYDLARRDGDIHKTASFLGHKRVDTTMRYRHLDAAQFNGLRD